MTDVAIKAVDEYPPSTSVKLNGPPGTGKTTQLLERVVSLLDQGHELGDITFVTYRKQMAEEFLLRLRDRGYATTEEVEEPWEHDTRHFGTIHGVCNRITTSADIVDDHHRREFCWNEYMIPYDGKNGAVPDDPNSRDDLGELLLDAYDWCIQNKQHSLHNAPQYIEIKDEWPACPSFEELDEAWTAYKQRGGNGEDCEYLQDFSDMLRTVDEEGLTAPGDILVIDEYHDFTPIMDSICRGWMDGKDTVIAVGDPKQAIYGHLGASPQYFTNLDLPEVILDRTYRVPSNIWEYAKSVIKHDVPSIQPDAEGGKVTAARSSPDAVVDSYGDNGSVMYLARTRSQLYEITQSLKENGIIYRSQERLGGWNNASRRLSLYNAFQKLQGARPMDGINPNTGQTGIEKFGDGSLGAVETLAQNVSLDPEEASALVRFTPAEHFADTKKSARNTINAASELPGAELMDMTEPSFWQAMTKGPDSTDEMLTYDAKPTLRAALERNDEPVTSLSSPEVPDVLTIHAAKGREADTVALYDGIPPAVRDNIHRDERAQHAESRVWYVAVTRAAENLLVFRDEYDYCEKYLPPITG